MHTPTRQSEIKIICKAVSWTFLWYFPEKFIKTIVQPETVEPGAITISKYASSVSVFD